MEPAYDVVFYFPGIVGEIGESNDEFYIWTHKKLDISYNNDQIVDVSLTSESKAKLTPNTKISFTYEVKHFVCSAPVRYIVHNFKTSLPNWTCKKSSDVSKFCHMLIHILKTVVLGNPAIGLSCH